MNFQRYLSHVLITGIALLGTLSASEMSVSQAGGAMLFPSVKQLKGSASETGLVQDHCAQAIASGSKPVRVPDGTTVEIVSETTVTYADANGTNVDVTVVKVKVSSTEFTDGTNGKAIGFTSLSGFMLKERLH